MKAEYSEVYAVDFDGTLNFGEWPQLGEPNKILIDFLIERRVAGDKVILWTCREGEQLNAAVKYCHDHGLSFDAINDNLQEHKEFFGNNSRKVYAHYYIDDKNFLPQWFFGDNVCKICGCTDYDCTHCVLRTGELCYWVTRDICSACYNYCVVVEE